MRLALIGTGNMGTAVESIAPLHGFEVVARFHIGQPLGSFDKPNELHGVDVAIDFTHPEVALANLERCCRWRLPVVIGTTGWYDQVDVVREWVKTYDASVLYAANFSMGVALLTHCLQNLAPLLDQLPQYDVNVHETHHIQKVDSPSGTALSLASILIDGIDRKRFIETETQHFRIETDALHVTSSRVGNVYGEHTINIHGPHDRLTLSHTATDRIGFAEGALTAARWLIKKRGLYNLSDIFGDWLIRSTSSK